MKKKTYELKDGDVVIVQHGERFTVAKVEVFVTFEGADEPVEFAIDDEFEVEV